MNIDGLVYLLNEAGNALAEANERLAQMSLELAELRKDSSERVGS